MNAQAMTVALAVRSEEERARLRQVAEKIDGIQLVKFNGKGVDLLVYELGEDHEQDFARVRKALGSGAARQVFLTCGDPDPELLIRAIRAGVREFLPQPIQSADFAQAILRMHNGHGPEAATGAGDTGELVVVAGAGGGLGSSTIAVNLAWQAARMAPGSAALADLVPGGDIPYFLDLDYAYTWGDLADNLDRLDPAFLESALSRHGSGLPVLAAPETLPERSGQVLEAVLSVMRQSFSLVVADARIDQLAELAPLAGQVVLPMALSLPSLARARRFLAGEAGEALVREDRLSIVVARHLKDSDIEISEAEDILGRKVAFVVPDNPVDALTALNQGRPLIELRPKCAASKALMRMAAELAPAPAPGVAPRRSLLGRLFSRGQSGPALAHGGAA